MRKNPWFFSIISLIFLTIPYIYYYLRIGNKNSFLNNNSLSYVIIFVLAVLFSLTLSKFFKINFNSEYKKILLFLFTAVAILYASFLFLMTMSNYNRMVSQTIDVHYYHQIVWQLSEFKVPYLYQLDKSVFAAWAQHFEPILFFIAPIYWMTKAAGVLVLLQAIVFISGIIPIYLTAKKYLHSRFAGISLAFAYLAFGGTQFGIAYGFHPIMFFPTIFLWMYYFYSQRRIKLYLLFVFLSLFVKEEVSFIMIFWGIYLFLFKKDKVLGLITSALGVFWYIVCFLFIFPKYSPAGFGYWGQYNQTSGTGVIGIIMGALLHPLDFLQTLITPSFKIDTFFQSFGAFGFLIFLFPPSFIIVLPSLLEKLLSTNIAAMNGTHYSAALTGVTLVATIESIYAIYRRKYFTNFFGNMHLFVGTLIFYLAFFFSMLYGYYAFSLIPNVQRTGYPVGDVMVEPSSENLVLLSKVIDFIPEQASVAAQYQIIPHIHRHYKLLGDIPAIDENVDYILVDTRLPPPVLTDTRLLNKYLKGLDGNKNYKLIVNQLGIVLFQRIDTVYKL